MRITPTEDGFSVEGELDMATAEDLAAVLRTADRKTPVVLDFSQVTFMDSSGLRVVLEAAGAMDGGGSLVILHPSPQVQRLLDVSIPGGVPGLEVRP